MARTGIWSKGDYLKLCNSEAHIPSIISLRKSVLFLADSIKIDLSHANVLYLCASYSEGFTHFSKTIVSILCICNK